jgi:TonB-linked SusC/RagA family outer membrane protein
MNFTDPIRHERLAYVAKKILRVMKLCIILMTSLLMQISAATKAQITLSERNTPLETIIKSLKKQSGYDFFYNGYDVKRALPITVNVVNVSIEAALKACFSGQNLTYSIEDRTVVIAALPLYLAQDLKGKIVNKEGVPLAGANIVNMRTRTGTISNMLGEFILKGALETDTLVISYIGYRSQTVPVKNRTSFQIIMEIAVNDLDKVVIQAYGTTTQRLNTGNIATVSSEQLERQPVMNVLAALQGQVAGLVVQQTSGHASAPFKIELRGRSGIDPSFPSDPLYIVDGVPLSTLNLGGGNYASGSKGFDQTGMSPAGGQSPFFSINPSDIESITVLKDADATAIYGSRGSNGVIIINTKTGKPGKTKLDVNVSQGASVATGQYKMLNTPQYIEMRREAFKNDQTKYGAIPSSTIPSPGNAYDLLYWDTNRYTDWQKFYYGGRGMATDVQLSISGGDIQNTFRLGGGYRDESNIFTKSGNDQRGSVQFNYNHKSINQRASLSFTSIYSFTRSDLQSESQQAITGNAWEAPNAPAVFDAEGNLNWAGWKPASFYLTSWSKLLQPYNAKTGLLNSQLTLKYVIFKGLEFSNQLGYSTVHGSQNLRNPIRSQNPEFSPKGSLTVGNSNIANFIIQPQLEYKTLLGKGTLNVLLGGSKQFIESDASTIIGLGYTNDNLLGAISGAPIKTASDGFSQYKYAAIYGRINYNWQNKYLLNVSGRRDGSSRFGPGKQFGNFGAVGAAWVFSEEKWSQALAFLSFGKLRASYGITGRDQIGDYGYLSQWSTSFLDTYQGILPYLPFKHANPDLQWESTRKIEVALNLGFLKDQLSFEISAYRNRSGNQLVSAPLPYITGFAGVVENSPALVQNSGLEMLFTGKIMTNTDFSWTANFNIAYNWNKLLDFPNLKQSQYFSQYTIGQSLGIKPLFHYTGVDPLTGEYTYEDKNHDGYISNYNPNGTDDLYRTMDMAVKFEGGFGTDFRYRKLQLNLFFNYRNYILPNSIYANSDNPISNQPIQVLDRWQKPGDQTRFPRFTTIYGQSDYLFKRSDGYYADASFIRLRNVSLSYDMPGKWLSKIGIREVKLYARGQNLFVITGYEGIDPEVLSAGTLPPTKSFTAGIKLVL